MSDVDSTKPCRKCRNPIRPSPRQIRKKDFLCGTCRVEYDRKRREKASVIKQGDKCAECDLEAVKWLGYYRYCAVHYRKLRVRAAARQDGKTVPSVAVVDQLFADVLANGMVCECCKRVMGWLRVDAGNCTASLQHDHGGGYRIICLACNKRHASYAGDSFYSLKPGHKQCHACKVVKPLSDFHNSSRGWLGKTQRCRSCTKIVNARRSIKSGSH